MEIGHSDPLLRYRLGTHYYYGRKDVSGILRTITQSFTVFASGTQVSESATPSATPVVTPTSVPISTPIPTSVPTIIPTIPVSPTLAPIATITPVISPIPAPEILLL